MKNPVEVQPPGGNRVFIVLRVIAPRDRTPFIPPLDDVPLDLGHGPGWELGERIVRCIHRWYDTHRQFLDRLEDGLTELTPLSSVHPPGKGFADVSAGQSWFDIVRFGDHRVLHSLAIDQHGSEGNVLFGSK